MEVSKTWKLGSQGVSVESKHQKKIYSGFVCSMLCEHPSLATLSVESKELRFFDWDAVARLYKEWCQDGKKALGAGIEDSSRMKDNLQEALTYKEKAEAADTCSHSYRAFLILDEDTWKMLVSKQNEISSKKSQYVEVRTLAERFMRANRSCIAAVPCHTKSTEQVSPIVMYLYMHTSGLGITDDFCKKAKKQLAGYSLKFVDLEQEQLGDYFTPRESEDQGKPDEMAKLAQIIEKNLSLFKNRSNVTAVYPSYKISGGQETNHLCIAVSVLGKKKIPIGEGKFPENIDGNLLDIVEGYFLPTSGPFLSKQSPLRFGVGIGVRGAEGAGTLGAFLTDGDNYYVLSCKHVLCKTPAAERKLSAKKKSNEEETPEKPAAKEKSAAEKNSADEKSAEGKPNEENSREETFVAETRPAHELEKEKYEECINGIKTLLKNGKLSQWDRKVMESQVKVPEEGEILIEQPAAEDFITEINEIEKKILENEKCLKEKETGADKGLTGEMDIDYARSKLKTSQEQLEYLRVCGLPRHIATYSLGLRENYYDSQHKREFFVDAGIAELSVDECDAIKRKGSMYSFEAHEVPINGEVVASNQIGEESTNVKFWKCGRTTRLTQNARISFGGFFFKDQKGFIGERSGDFEHIRCGTYCQTCAQKVGVDCFETDVVGERKCGQCPKTISPTEKKNEFWGRNCFLVKIPRNKFSEEGDSGSVIFDNKGRAWGIIVGVFNRGDSVFTVASSLDIVFRALSKELGKKLQLWCVPNQS